MKVSPFAPKRPALAWYGGGWTRAPWTIGFFPEAAQVNFIDPTFGPGSVTLRKPQARLESINDKDRRVTNFFTQLRDNRDKLLELIKWSPYSQAELERCIPVAGDPLEDARRFFILCWLTLQGGPTARPGDFRYQKNVDNRYAPPPWDIMSREDLYVTADRLRGVQIFNEDAIVFIRRFLQQESCVVYLDLPYLQSTRARKKGYNHEPSPAYHRLAAQVLRQHKGYVIVAGYKSRLYERMYEAYGYQRVERVQKDRAGNLRVECLWLCPRTQQALAEEKLQREKRPLSLTLFDGVTS